MAIKFQYNKTSLQQLEKQLNIRVKALPTLKNKEAALRAEVKKSGHRIDELAYELRLNQNELDDVGVLWNEFDFSILKIQEVITEEKRLAGVKAPFLKEIKYKRIELNPFGAPFWIWEGLELLKKRVTIEIKQKVLKEQLSLIELARKKTTQKVNLYEKVQIPEYEITIRKVKRFLEDEENLTKAAQKIVKKRLEAAML